MEDCSQCRFKWVIGIVAAIKIVERVDCAGFQLLPTLRRAPFCWSTCICVRVLGNMYGISREEVTLDVPGTIMVDNFLFFTQL